MVSSRVAWGMTAGLAALVLAGCGAHSAHPAAHVKPSSHAHPKSHAKPDHQTHSPGAISPGSTGATGSAAGSASSAPFGSVAWSTAAQTQLAATLHESHVAPLMIIPTATAWHMPAGSLLVVEPLAYHQHLYYTVATPHQPLVWQSVSTDLPNVSTTAANQVPQPLYVGLHFAQELMTGTQLPSNLGVSIAWNDLTGNVQAPVGWVVSYLPAASGTPATAYVGVMLPIQWAHPAADGALPAADPNGSIVSVGVSGTMTSDTWTLSNQLPITPANQASSLWPATATQGDFAAQSGTP